jgi:peptidoglycan/xylan/chitin deacetylase (PgdA/CDA1 family)
MLAGCSLGVAALIAVAPAWLPGQQGQALAEPVVTEFPTSAAPLPTLTPSPVPPSATPIGPPTALVYPTQALIEPTDGPIPTPGPTYQPTPGWADVGRQVRVPVLLYHYIEPVPADASPVREGLTVTPELFAQQIEYLAANGYTTISLYDLSQAVATGAPLPAKPVILTFDDGYSSVLTYAVPVMERLGFKGTVFVITEFVDTGRPGYLTWDELRRLHTLGWQIEAHTKTHAQLEDAGYDHQLYEMLGSIETLTANIGQRPRYLSYPAGRYDATSVWLAEQLHLWGAVTTNAGRWHDFASRYTWPRQRIDGRFGLQGFIDQLEGDQ